MFSRLLAVIAAALGLGLQGSLPGITTAGDRTAWRTLLHWPNSCERSWRGQTGAGIAGVWWLGQRGWLVAVDCSQAAYQGTSMLYLLGRDRRATGPLRLRIYRDPGTGVPTPTRETLVLGNLVFSGSTRTLAVTDLFRGTGDCGIYSTFRLVGSHLVPVEARAKTRCDGKPPYDGSRWPRLPLP